MPVFLVGALGPFINEELGIDPAGFGLAVAAYFATSALASAPAGRGVEVVGSQRGGVIAGTISVVTMLAIGLAAASWLHLVLLLALGGIGNAIAQVSSNLAVARGVVHHRQGLAFGVKQAAIPFATLMGGLAVAFVALGPGWRWAFALGPLMFILWLLTLPRIARLSRPSHAATRSHLSWSPSLIALAAAAGFAAAAANAMGSFFVASAVSSSVAAPDAGLLLVVGSCCGIASRVVVGWRADYMHVDRLTVVASMMAGGAVGAAFLATGAGPQLAVGIILGFAAGWGWTGLLSFAVVREYPNAPAAATGVTQAGIYVGGVIGPLGFGLMVERASYGAAWIAACLLLLAASALIVARGRFLPAPATQRLDQ